MSITPFLRSVAVDLWNRFSERLADITIVLPTRRSRLYLSEHLANLIDKPVWQPTYLTIEELMTSHTSLKIADSYQLLIELYKVYVKHKRSEESFDHFYFWGEAMLNDFDIIDKYRVNASLLFKNLADQKELEGDYSFLDEEQIRLIQSFWQSFNPTASDVQQKFIEIWDILYPIYEEFKKNIRQKNIAYEGMVARLLVEELERGEHVDHFNGTFALVGLNALNECEKSLFRFLQKQGQALFYWDYDEYYVEDERQEAGMFIRDSLKSFPPEKINDSFRSFQNLKDIRAIASTGGVMQTKLVPTLLKELSADGKQLPSETRTAIILSDETLLMPLLYALPENEDVNVTMGYPFSQTTVFTLVDLLIQLQRNSKQSKKGEGLFYHKDVQVILNHPYIKRLSGGEAELLLQNIIKNNRVYVGEQLFRQNALLKYVFTLSSDYVVMTDYLTGILTRIAEANLDDNSALRREYAFYFISSIRKLKKAIGQEGMDIGLPVFLSLLRAALRKIRIPFSGEPLSGTQVMGILETRALDFENVLILSLNEGLFPPPISSISFIPYNLRRGFGLPAVEHHEAMYAYYFYRIVQRAKNVRLLYSTKADSGKAGEPSRYLYQLKMESSHMVKEQAVSYSVAIDTQNEIIVIKTKEVLEKLDERAQSGLSPSAISCYISCPLQFYFKYILGMKELNEVDEEVDMALFGNILHHTMEELYRPFISRTIDREIITTITKDTKKTKQLVDKAFANVYFNLGSLPDDFEQNGRLSIIRDVVYRYVMAVLRYDMIKTPFTLKMLEEEINLPYSFSVNGHVKEIRLKGILDRVDEIDGRIAIVDYKTGKNKREFKGVGALFSDTLNEQNSAVFQTFLYALMYEMKNGEEKPLAPTLYFVRDIQGADFSPAVVERKSRMELEEVSDFSAYRKNFIDKLNELLAGVFDAKQPFTQTTDIEICKTRCPFTLMCNRKT